MRVDNEFFYDESTSTLYYYSSSGAPVGDVEMTLHKTFLSIVGTVSTVLFVIVAAARFRSLLAIFVTPAPARKDRP